MKGGFRAPVRQQQRPQQAAPTRTPGGQTNTPNPNAGRAQGSSNPGDNKGAFGTTAGAGAGAGAGGGGFMGSLGQGLAFAGGGLIISDLMGGSALDNLSQGVGSAVGGIGEGVGDLASGVGGAAQGLGQGAGGLASGIGSGVSSFGANLPYLALAAAAVGVIFLMKK